MRIESGKVCVVTGAASGIGLALATQLAQRGCALALVDLDESKLEQARASLAVHGAPTTLHRADVSDRARMEALATEIEAEYGRVDLLVNNAGVTAAGLFSDQPMDDFEWVVRINLFGVAYGCKVFLPLLRAARGAHVVNMSSAAGFAGLPGQAAYCASKFGVHGFSEALRAELGAQNIGVTSVHPGAIRTDILRSMRTTDPDLKGKLVQGMDKFGMRPERVARGIIKAVERNRSKLVIGPDAQLIAWSQRLAPRVFGALMGRVYRATTR